MTLCFQLHSALGGSKDERPYENRLGSWHVPAQTQVLAAGMSQAASWRRPRTAPDAALQPRGPAWSHTPRFRWQTLGPRVSPVPSGRAGSVGGMGWALVPGGELGWAGVPEAPHLGLASTRPASGHRGAQGSRSRGPQAGKGAFT